MLLPESSFSSFVSGFEKVKEPLRLLFIVYQLVVGVVNSINYCLKCYNNSIMDAMKLEEIKKIRKIVWNVNKKHRESFTPLEKFAIWITERIGTMGFFFLLFAWTIVWLIWNIFAPPNLKFDPFPAFVLWLFISNMLQLFFLPLIMVGQNLQGRHAEMRAESDFEINLKAEKELETILESLEKQEKNIAKILDKLTRS